MSVAYVIYVGILYLPLSLVSLPNLEQQGQDFLTLCVIKPQNSGKEQRKERGQTCAGEEHVSRELSETWTRIAGMAADAQLH